MNKLKKHSRERVDNIIFTVFFIAILAITVSVAISFFVAKEKCSQIENSVFIEGYCLDSNSE